MSNFSFGFKLKFQNNGDVNVMYLENTEGRHNKFMYLRYHYEPKDLQNPHHVNVRFGKLQTIGQSKTHKFSDELTARKFMLKKVQEKTAPNKGYVRIEKPTNKFTMNGIII